MARPFRLFEQYEFFGVFLPGFVCILLLYGLFPDGFSISIGFALVPALTLSFVLGQLIHFVSLYYERALYSPPEGVKSSNDSNMNEYPLRTEFISRFPPSGTSGSRLTSTHQNQCKKILARSEIESDAGNSDRGGEEEPEEMTKAELYRIATSYLKTHSNSTRYEIFDSVYAFSRSMAVISWLGVMTYALHPSVSSHFAFQQIKYEALFRQNLEGFVGFLVFMTISGVVFTLNMSWYRNLCVQYLISDFASLSIDHD